jgi:hypothetical protein
LEEWIHLLENFTLPALRDKNSYMINFTHKTDLILPNDYNKEVIKSIIKTSWDLLKENRWSHFDDYLLSYVELLLQHFSNRLKNTN